MSAIKNFVPPETPPKYFALDVDGTFHAHDKKAFEKNIKAFRKMVEAGYRPFCATGRPLLAMHDVLKDLYADGVYRGFPGVYQNGGTVYNEHGEIISTTKFSEKFVRAFCSIVERNVLSEMVIFLSRNTIYSMINKPECWAYLSEIWKVHVDVKHATIDEIASAEIVQIMVTDYKLFKPHTVPYEGVEYITKHGACGFCDYNPIGTTKAHGIAKLLEGYGVEPSKCGFIGDAHNDVEAMRVSNLSFAVGNANDRVKAAAKYVLEETNEESAFAKAISLVACRSCLQSQTKGGTCMMNSSKTCTVSVSRQYDANNEDFIVRGKDVTTLKWPITNFVPLRNPPTHFAIDIDGTFLSCDPEIMKRNLDAFEKAIKTGYNLFLSTGRGLQDALRVIPKDMQNRIGFTGYPGVYQNGAVVYGHDGQLLQHSYFRKDVLTRIVECIQVAKYEKYAIFLTQDEWFVVTKDMSYFDYMIDILKLETPLSYATIDEVMENYINKVIIVDYKNVANHFKDMDGVDLISKSALHDITDLTPIGITKGSGLKVLLGELQASPSQCGYVGDADNDIEAMQLVEHSFAVGNARDSVKAAAKHIVQQTNTEGAFATIMDAVYGIDGS